MVTKQQSKKYKKRTKRNKAKVGSRQALKKKKKKIRITGISVD